VDTSRAIQSTDYRKEKQMKSKKKKTKTVRNNKNKLREERANRSAPGTISIPGKIGRTVEFFTWFDRTWQQRIVRVQSSDDDHIVNVDIESSLDLREMAAWLTAAAEWMDNQEDN
jgi:hypothetical protein